MAVGILGDGVTARSVRSFVHHHPNFQEVSIDSADFIVASPGIPPEQWPDTSVNIMSELDFAYSQLSDPKPTIIGITGTNGKTTVASGLAHVLNTNAYGNIGTPLIEGIGTHPYLVVECSSFQLATSSKFAVDIAVILNITTDHLAWHGTFSSYFDAKYKLITSQTKHCIVSKHLPNFSESLCYGNIDYISDLPKTTYPQFMGRHNQENAAVIAHVASLCGVPDAIIQDRLDAFSLPPFRCHLVYSDSTRQIINDSKATNMAATLAAVRSISGPKLLILAGQSKGCFSQEWADEVSKQCDMIFVAGHLATQSHVFPDSFLDQVQRYSTVEDATIAALKEQKDGTILFSPGAASFDEFDDQSQ